MPLHRWSLTLGVSVLSLGAALAGAPAAAARPPEPGAHRTAAQAAPRSPSGESLPTKKEPGWRPIFTDDFLGTAVDPASWAVFNGQRAPQYWSRHQVTVSDGVAHLRAEPGPDGHWVTGAMTNARRVRQTYGKYLIRGRFGVGAGVRGLELLWPSGGHAPPEVDFFEVNGTDPLRLRNTESVHFGTNYHQDHGVVHTWYPAPAGSSFADWHTIGVEWSPGRIAYTCDDVVQRVVTENVPDEPMWLGIAEGLGTIKPTGTIPVDFDIDWVAIYAYDG